MFKHVAVMRAADNFFRIALALFVLAGCNRMATPPEKQLLKDADAKVVSGDFLPAIDLYESALDGTAKSAEIHYKLALLYDDKMNDPLNAMHHFKRYLTLAPTGSRAEEVKNFMKKDELALLTTLSGDSVMPRAEAARLKSENLSLRQQIEERRLEAHNAATSRAATRAKATPHSKKKKRSAP